MSISAIMRTFGTFSILAILLLAGCVQGSSNVSSLPTTQPATSGSISISAVNSATSNEPAEEMTISQLLADYAADPVKAAAQHEGKRYLFRNVLVEEVSSLYKPASTDMFIMSQGIKFRPDYMDQIGIIKVGDIVDVEGTVSEPQWSFIVLKHCSYTIIDDSNGLSRPDYQNTFA
jgi:hypothetical protein